MVLMTVMHCENCKKEMDMIFFKYKGKPTHLGGYVCPLCRQVEIPDEFERREK